MKKLKLTIEGIHCASCGTNIESSVSKVKGVKSITVNVMMKKAYVEVEDKLDTKELKKAVEKVGYKIKEIEEE